MGFKPSQYQEDIFEFIKYGYGNAVISAVAGSGKSSTIIKALDFIKPERRVLFLAFNSSIVDELKTKITREKTDIKTLHSLGYSMIRYHFKDKDIQIYEHKYKDALYNIFQKHGIDFAPDKKYIKIILKLCDLGRFYLVKDAKDLINIANKYGIILSSNDEIDWALQLISWAKDSLYDSNLIDFTDMVYLPNVLNLKAFKYDFIMIDEAQDLSISQMELFMKCIKQGSRFIAVGDEKQAIYSFSGADAESFSKLRNMPNTIELPLSICYRCPKNVIKLAQKIVPEIECSDKASDGFINYKAKISDLADGDMVICRNTLPLAKLYVKLISNNITAYIKGTDIGVNLIELLDDFTDDLSNLDSYLNQILDLYLLNNFNDKQSESDIRDSQEFNNLLDKIDCLKIIAVNVKSKSELIEKITAMFADENKEGICLSTIHKAKGLEADNVYILDKNLMPSKFAKQPWESSQEKNLEYVAFTRSKNVLGFLNI